LQIQNCRPAHKDFSSLTHIISLTITRLLSDVHVGFDRLASWRMKIPVVPGTGSAPYRFVMAQRSSGEYDN